MIQSIDNQIEGFSINSQSIEVHLVDNRIFFSQLGNQLNTNQSTDGMFSWLMLQWLIQAQLKMEVSSIEFK